MKDNMNILVVSSKFPPEYAGSGLRAHRTYKRLAARCGFKYSILTSSVSRNKVKRYKFEDLNVYRIACKPFRKIEYGEHIKNESFIKKVKRKCANGANYLCEAALTWAYLLANGRKFDLIHIFGNNYVTAAVLTYAKVTKKRVILEICNVSKRYRQYEPLFFKMLYGRDLARGSRVVCISERIKDAFRKGCYTQDVWCRPNPVDTSKFFPDKANKLEHRKRLDLFSSEDKVLLNIGKLCPLKNQIFLLDVLKSLPEEYKLFIGGPVVTSGPDNKRDTTYLNELKERIKIHGLSARVKVAEEFIEDVDKYMKASDIYLLPSKIEACATPVLEAAACGMPVVAHRIEGVTTEWIREGADGYLSSLDTEAFAGNIEKAALLNEDALREKSQRIADTVSVDHIDGLYANMIKELICAA